MWPGRSSNFTLTRSPGLNLSPAAVHGSPHLDSNSRQLPIDFVLGEDFLFDQNGFDAGDPTLVISHVAISGGIHFFARAAHFVGALDAFGAERLIDRVGEYFPVGELMLGSDRSARAPGSPPIS